MTGLILLVARLRVPAFIALVIAGIAMGLSGGLDVKETLKAFEAGVGAILGSVALIVGLGTVLGKLLAESGGAQLIARRLLEISGPRSLPWMMALLGFVVGPVFFSLGLVLLAPVLFAVWETTRMPFLRLAVPLLAGLSAAQCLVPPHPGPMAAVELIKADVGKTLLYSIAVGVGTVVISGPVLYACCPWLKTVEPAGALGAQFTSPHRPKNPPAFFAALLAVLLPVVLIALAAAADLIFRADQPARKIADALGTPLGALLISVLISFQTLGTACGYDAKTLLKFTDECMSPIASILLVIGAGAGFGKVMVVCGVGDAISHLAQRAPVSPLIFAWLIAAVIRIATGSATVAIITAAGIVAPIAATAPRLNRELLVLAMGGGSIILSHVNDGGFWLVKEYLGLTVNDTFKSWTVVETVLSISALGFTLLLNAFIG